MIVDQVNQKMQDAIGHLKVELAQIRTGRANPTLISDLEVEAYNTKMLVKELAQITAPDPATLLVSPWDKTIISNIAGAITKANIGLNPVIESDLVRITIPALTSERREQLIKQMHALLEKYRVEIRHIRHEFIGTIREQQKSGEISEDQEKRYEHEVQKVHDQFIEAIEVAGKHKEGQLREV